MATLKIKIFIKGLARPSDHLPEGIECPVEQ
jgi:hypothetical protein